MSKVFEYMKPYIGYVICIAILLFVEACCALILPKFMADIVNEGVLSGNIPFIRRTGIIMLLITILNVFVAVIVGYLIAKTATGIANDLRQSMFNKVINFSNAEINKFTTSSLITRTTNDITQIQNTLMMAIRQFIYAPILGVGGIVLALNRNVSMTWIIALSTVVMVLVMVILFIVALPKFKIIQSLIDKLNLVSRENLSGILVVRAFNTQKFENKRFDKANKDLAETNLFVDQTFALVSPIINLILNLTTVLVVWIGVKQASAFKVDIGDIFAFLQYGILIIFAFLMVASMLVFLPRAVVSAERVRDVLNKEESIKFAKVPLLFSEDFKGSVEFRNVSFRYPDASILDDNVLNDLNFTAKHGEITAIIGSTGSGKTTILKLLLRFFDVTQGVISIDGVDLRDVSKKDLHSKIAYVSQKALLFTGTIHSNLLYADKNADDNRVREAVKIAQVEPIINEKSEGYDSNVAQGGVNFSGGQKQRLSIARALVKNAQIYLFDDSFSALDLKTDALLRAELKKQMSKKTIIIVAQRISTIMDADHIIVLNDGNIVGLGKHSDLLKTCEVYKEIANSQLTEEELLL